jgi:hypothetical protein
MYDTNKNLYNKLYIINSAQNYVIKFSYKIRTIVANEIYGMLSKEEVRRSGPFNASPCYFFALLHFQSEILTPRLYLQNFRLSIPLSPI